MARKGALMTSVFKGQSLRQNGRNLKSSGYSQDLRQNQRPVVISKITEKQF